MWARGPSPLSFQLPWTEGREDSHISCNTVLLLPACTVFNHMLHIVREQIFLFVWQSVDSGWPFRAISRDSCEHPLNIFLNNYKEHWVWLCPHKVSTAVPILWDLYKLLCWFWVFSHCSIAGSLQICSNMQICWI